MTISRYLNFSSREYNKFTLFIIWLLIILSMSNSPVFADENRDNYSRVFSFDELKSIKIRSVSLRDEKLLEAPGTVVVITAKQIKERGYEFFIDLLRDIPGFDLVHVNGSWRTIFTQRGTYTGENSRSLILIDGIADSNILEGAIAPGGQYSLHNVKRVEFLYGPASALYGSNAFGGIISITTKSAEDINGFQYQVGYGSDDSRFHKLLFGKQFDNFEATFSAHIYNTDGVAFKERTPHYSNSYVDDAYSIVGRVKIDNYSFGFSHYNRPAGWGTHTDVSGYDQDGQGSGILQSDFNGEKPSLWHTKTETLFIKGEQELGSDITLNESLYYRSTTVGFDTYAYTYIPTTDSVRKLPFGHFSEAIGAEFIFDYTPNSIHDFIWGLHLEESDVEQGYRQKLPVVDATTSDGIEYELVPLVSNDDRSSLRISDTYRNIATYTQYRRKTTLFRSTNFIFGVRYDYNNQYGTDFSYGKTIHPRIGAVIKPIDDLILKILYGTAFRAPTSFDRYTETNIRRANPDLEPEQVETLELGVNITSFNNIIWETTIYHTKYTNSIISNVDTGEPIPDNPTVNFAENRNAGRGAINGVEFRVKAVYDDSDVFFNLTYQDAHQHVNGIKQDWPNIAEFKANVGLTYRYQNMFSVYLVENWVGSRSTIATNPKRKVKGYALTNLSIQSGQFWRKKMNISLSVNNLFDKNWVDPGIRAANGSYYSTTLPQPGRNYMMKAGFKF